MCPNVKFGPAVIRPPSLLLQKLPPNPPPHLTHGAVFYGSQADRDMHVCLLILFWFICPFLLGFLVFLLPIGAGTSLPPPHPHPHHHHSDDLCCDMYGWEGHMCCKTNVNMYVHVSVEHKVLQMKPSDRCTEAVCVGGWQWKYGLSKHRGCSTKFIYCCKMQIPPQPSNFFMVICIIHLLPVNSHIPDCLC